MPQLTEHFYGRTMGSAWRSILVHLTRPAASTVSDSVYSEYIGAQLYVTEPSFNLILSREYKPNYIDAYKFAIRTMEQMSLGFETAMTRLKEDSSTTRASMFGLGEYPNLTSVQFFIRDGGLYEIVTTRANDAWFNLPRDLQAFGFWGQLFAGALGVPFAGYIHNFGSLYLDRGYVKEALNVVRLDHVDAVASPLPPHCDKALREIFDGRASEAIERPGEPYQTSPLGMQPIVNAILGWREYAPAILNDLAAKGYGVGWPQVKASSVAPSQ